MKSEDLSICLLLFHFRQIICTLHEVLIYVNVELVLALKF